MPEISKKPIVPEHRGVLARRMPSVFISYSHVAANPEHGQNVLSRTVKYSRSLSSCQDDLTALLERVIARIATEL
jgi:hypothetical protein